jgi:UDP-glucose:glycoprotein glucosyltransferase
MSCTAGKHIILKVQKRTGKEKLSLLFEKKEGSDDVGALEDDWEAEEDTGVWQSFKGALGMKGADKVAANSTINVFTVASGHMYERLQKIMILSVIKNTKSR